MKKRLHRSTLNFYEKDGLDRFVNRLNFYDLQSIKDPLLYWRYLQKRGSVHYLPTTNEWLVLDYRDIEYVLQTPEIFSSSVHKLSDEYLLGSDPPSHTVIRSLLQPLFSQQRLNIVSNFVSEKATELLENLNGRPAFDFVEDFSLPLTQATIAKFVGFTDDDNMAMKQCLEGHPYELKFFGSTKDYCKEYLENEIEAQKNLLGSILLNAVNENKLPFEGAASVMSLLWVAGMITTSMLMSTAFLLLMKDAALARRLVDDDQLLNKFIEECLRLDSPETEARRITTRQTELGGRMLPAGAIVVLKLKAANRDSKYFENPDEICLDRSTKKHLAFGGGSHYCLGAGMARIEVKAVLKLILPKLSRWKLDEANVEYFLSHHFRAIKNLPVVINA